MTYILTLNPKPYYPITLLEQLALTYVLSEIGPAMNAHELELDLNNSYIHTEEEMTSMLVEREHATKLTPSKELIVYKLTIWW